MPWIASSLPVGGTGTWQPLPSTQLLDMIWDMCGFILPKCWQEFCTNVITHWYWKWLRKVIARSLNKANPPLGISIYHFAAGPVRVRWNILKQIESWCKEFEEHQWWKVVTCLLGSSPSLPSNLGMSEGSLVGTASQARSWAIGSFVNLDKSGRFSVVRKGSLGWLGQWNAP